MADAQTEVKMSLDVFQRQGIQKILGFPETKDGSDPYYNIKVVKPKDRDSKSETYYMVHYNEDTIARLPLDDPRRFGRGAIVSLKHGVKFVSSFGYTPTVLVDGELIRQDDGFLAVRNAEGKIDPIVDEDGKTHRIPYTPRNVVGDNPDFKRGQSTLLQLGFEGTILRIAKFEGEYFFATHKNPDALDSTWGKSNAFSATYNSLGGPAFKDLFDETKKYAAYVCVFMIVEPNLNYATKINCGSGWLIYMGSRDQFTRKSVTKPGLQKWDEDENDVCWEFKDSPFYKQLEKEIKLTQRQKRLEALIQVTKKLEAEGTITEATRKELNDNVREYEDNKTQFKYFPTKYASLDEKKMPPLPTMSRSDDPIRRLVIPTTDISVNMSNIILKYGIHYSEENDKRMKDLDPRLWPGESVVLNYLLPDNTQMYVRLMGRSYKYRVWMAGNNPMRLNQAFILMTYSLGTSDQGQHYYDYFPYVAVLDNRTMDEMKVVSNGLFPDKENIEHAQRLTEGEQQRYDEEKGSETILRDYKLRNIIAAFAYAVPLHFQHEIWSYYGEIIAARQEVATFIIKHQNFAESKITFSKDTARNRVINILSTATKNAESRIKEGSNYRMEGRRRIPLSRDELIVINIQNLVNKEFGNTLYQIRTSIRNYNTSISQTSSGTVSPAPSERSQLSGIVETPRLSSVTPISPASPLASHDVKSPITIPPMELDAKSPVSPPAELRIEVPSPPSKKSPVQRIRIPPRLNRPPVRTPAKT